MSNSKPLPSFTFDVLCYLNRDQLERFSIVCHPLKNLIDRYFSSKPYRIFDELHILGVSYVLCHNFVYWRPNRDDYSVQQFLAGRRCKDFKYCSFAEMRPYLGPTVRVKETAISRDSTYNPEQIEQMESIAYIWRDRKISIPSCDDSRIVSEDFQRVLNSPTILQCQTLYMDLSLNFPFKDYKVLYAVKVIWASYLEDDIDLNYWLQFLEQPGVKPVIIIPVLRHEHIINLLDRFSKAFSSAVSPNAFKIAFLIVVVNHHEPLTEFRETNNTSGEILEMKKGFPTENQAYYLENLEKYAIHSYTLKRSSI